MSVDYNIFTNNQLLNHVVRWNYLSFTSSSTLLSAGRVRFRHNRLINNTAIGSSQLQCVMYYGNGGGEPVSVVHDNVFSNPGFACDFRTELNYNASHNYWGTDDEAQIRNRIYDRGQNFKLHPIFVYPFYTSPDLTNLTTAPVLPFYNPKTKSIRGELSSVVTLTYDNGPIYTVDGEVFILSTGGLILEP